MIRKMQEHEYHLLAHYLLLACYVPPNSSEKITLKLGFHTINYDTQESEWIMVKEL